jgi:hypothetical protein
MKDYCKRVVSALLAAILLGVPAAVFAQVIEVEPNDPCFDAQAVGPLPGLPTIVSGSLDDDFSADPPHDVDFFRFEATPGEMLRSELRGAGSGVGTLGDPYLGLFDSGCNLLDINDDSDLGLESRLDFQVPGDGVFILAASACCDLEGWHGAEGSYELSIFEPPPPPPSIGSISGRLVDAVSGMPLPGDAPPFSYVELRRCDEFGCFDSVNSGPTDANGRFYFDTMYDGDPLLVGEYLIAAWADEYESAEFGPFYVDEDEHYDAGDIALQPPPLTFSNIVPCDNVPVNGGLCSYSVDVNNNTTDPLQGIVWSNVEAWGTGSPLGFTRFPAQRSQNVRVPALSSRTVKFSFEVLPGVADGAVFCADGWFSYREMSYYGTILNNDGLFCVMKQYGAFTTLEPKVAKGLLDKRRDVLDRSRGPKK